MRPGHGAADPPLLPEASENGLVSWLDRQVPVGVLAVTLGLFAAVVGVFRSWRPSLWLDEVATIVAVGRSWPELIAMLGRVDAVHGLFYLLLKPWTDLVGTSPGLLRLPSALAIGLAVIGLVLLTDRLLGRTAALWAGMLLAVLPAATGAAVEARSGAWTIAVVVWTTLLLLQALSLGSWAWAGYAAAMGVSGLLFFPTLSMGIAHGIALLWCVRRREVLLRWAGALAAGVAPLVPFLILVRSQREQVSWIKPVTLERAVRILVTDAWFRNPLPAVFAWALILLVAWRSRASRAWKGSPSAVGLALPWALTPILLLTAVSLAVPMLQPRYLLFSAPAAVLLIVAGIGVVPVRVQVIPVLALALACLPVYLHQRTEFAKFDSDWAAASRVVAADAHPGDAVLFVPETHGPKNQRSPRRAMDGYPDAFAGLKDPGLIATGRELGDLWGDGLPLDQAAARLNPGQTVWILVSRYRPARTVEEAELLLAEVGLKPVLIWKGPKTMIFTATG